MNLDTLFSPALLFVIAIWAAALLTFTQPIKRQLVLLWIFLPFVDLLKRLVFLDPGAGSAHMYMILFSQDIIMVIVLGKLLLQAFTRPFKLHLNQSDLPLIAFTLVSLLSALLSPGAPLTARLSAAGMWVWPAVAYFLYAQYMNNPQALKILTKLLIVTGVVVALYGAFQFFGGLFPFEAEWYARSTNSANVRHLQYNFATRGFFRTFSTMDSHSSYGLFLGMGLILSWNWRKKLGRFLYGLISLILLIGLVLSFTRFTWLMPVLAVGFIFMFSVSRVRPLINFRRYRRAAWLLVIIIGSFGVFYLVMALLYNTGNVFNFITNPYLKRALTTGTLEARLQLSTIISKGAQLSLIGDGLANASYFASKFGYVSSDVNYHNIFLDIQGSMGWVGLASFVWFLYTFFRQSLIRIHSEQDPHLVSFLSVVFSLLLALIMVGHFNGPVFYYGRALPVYFWGLCGILAHFRTPLFSFQKVRTHQSQIIPDTQLPEPQN